MNSWNPKTVRDELAKRAKELGIRTPQIQNLLAQERFLARLGKTEFGTKFVWKGGSLLIRAYSQLEIPRYTIDLDLLVKGIAVEQVWSIFEKVKAVHLGDGFVFKEISSGPMERDLPYGGERFEISWTLFGKQNSERLKIDVAAGDVVEPAKMTSSELFLCPDIDENISMLVYPPEFIIAEKLETVLRFGTGNTRVKDLIDLWSLQKLDIAPEKQWSAIAQCFKNRKTGIDLDQILEIFEDKEFREFVNSAIGRNYAYLKLPATVDLLSELEDWVSRLKLRRGRNSG